MKLLQNLKRKPLFQLHPRGAEDGTDGPCRSTLLSNNLTEVALSYSEFKNSCLFTLDRPNRDLIRIIHQGFRDLFDELLHSHPQTRLSAFPARNMSYK